MSNIINNAVEIYTFIDDLLKKVPQFANWRRSNHFQVHFSDSEVLTIALIQPILQTDTLKSAFEHIRDNYRFLFPQMCSYSQWIRRLHALSAFVGKIVQESGCRALDGCFDRYYSIDSKALPVCEPIRHGRVLLLRDEGAAFGKTHEGWFFGFKLHCVVHTSTNAILGAILTPGNFGDRDAGELLASGLGGGIALTDQGYSGDIFFDFLHDECQMTRVMPSDAGIKGSSLRKLVSAVRQGIETEFSRLWTKFIDRLFSRSWNGLWNTVKIKLAYFNLKLAGIIS